MNQSIPYSSTAPDIMATDFAIAKTRHIVPSDRIVSRNGGVMYISIMNTGTSSGQFVSSGIICNLRGTEKEFWIFACPLWECQRKFNLEPGVNLVELAVQGYSLLGKESIEAIRHISYIYEMVKIRTLSILRAEKEAGKDLNAIKRKANNIYKYVEAISNLGATDDGVDYRLFEAVNEDIECVLEIITLEPDGTKNVDRISLNALGLGFWLANYNKPINSKLIIEFKQLLSLYDM